jgi:hypothetical protein
MSTSQVETNLDGLRPKLIPIPLVKQQFTVPIKQLFGRLFGRGQGGKKVPEAIQVTRTQLPIVPAFAITTYKVQGLTMIKIVVDLQVRVVTLQVASIYVHLSRVKRAEDVAILGPFDMKVLQVRHSPAQILNWNVYMNFTERNSENVLLLLFEMVSVNSLLIVQKHDFQEKELSESLDERYLFLCSVFIC